MDQLQGRGASIQATCFPRPARLFEFQKCLLLNKTCHRTQRWPTTLKRVQLLASETENEQIHLTLVSVKTTHPCFKWNVFSFILHVSFFTEVELIYSAVFIPNVQQLGFMYVSISS